MYLLFISGIQFKYANIFHFVAKIFLHENSCHSKDHMVSFMTDKGILQTDMVASRNQNFRKIQLKVDFINFTLTLK